MGTAHLTHQPCDELRLVKDARHLHVHGANGAVMHRGGDSQPLRAPRKCPAPKHRERLVGPQRVSQRRRAAPPGAASCYCPQIQDAGEVHDAVVCAQHLCSRIDASYCLHRGIRVRVAHQVCFVEQHHIRVGHLQLRQLAGGGVKQELLHMGGIHDGDHPIQHRPRLQRIVRPQGLDYWPWVRQACRTRPQSRQHPGSVRCALLAPSDAPVVSTSM